MTVYGVIDSDGDVIALYESPADACRHGHYLADRKWEELQEEIADGCDITVERRGDMITVKDNSDHNYDEVWIWWVKSMDVLEKYGN